MLKNNKLNLLISIVCALALWAYITTVVNPTTERTIGGVTVDLVNIDALNDRGFTVGEGMTWLVDVTVSGARSEVAKLMPSDFRATADMAGYRKGTQSVLVNVTGPANMELVQVRPDNISVEVVDLITVFKPVRIEYEDTFAYGQEPGFIQVIPDEMEVWGVTDVVDSIDYMRVIVPSGELTEELRTFRLEVESVGKDGQVVNNYGVSQNLIEVTGMLCYTRRVPLNIDTIGEANESFEVTYMYIPGYITIRGSHSAIEGITEVEGRPVDLSTITSTMEIPIDASALNLPEGVEIAEASKGLSVHIEVQGIARKEFTYTADMIDIVNLDPSLSGHVNTGSVTVTVLAPRDVLSDLTQDDVKLYVDASEQRWAGNSIEMEVTAECKSDVKDIIIDPKKVRITIIRE